MSKQNAESDKSGINNYSCAEVREMLGAYCDGELSEKESAAVLCHVAECAECAKELDAIKELAELVGGIAEEPPAELFDGIIRAVGREKRKARFTAAIRRFAVPAAAALLVLIAIPVLINRPGADKTGNGDALVPSEALYTGIEGRSSDSETFVLTTGAGSAGETEQSDGIAKEGETSPAANEPSSEEQSVSGKSVTESGIDYSAVSTVSLPADPVTLCETTEARATYRLPAEGLTAVFTVTAGDYETLKNVFSASLYTERDGYCLYKVSEELIDRLFSCLVELDEIGTGLLPDALRKELASYDAAGSGTGCLAVKK